MWRERRGVRRVVRGGEMTRDAVGLVGQEVGALIAKSDRSERELETRARIWFVKVLDKDIDMTQGRRPCETQVLAKECLPNQLLPVTEEVVSSRVDSQKMTYRDHA